MIRSASVLLLLAAAATSQTETQDASTAQKGGDEGLAARATTAFGLDLYRALAGKSPGENLALSPWSAAIALTMTAEGARDETRAQLLRVLHLQASELASAHASFGDLIRRFDEGGGATGEATRARLRLLQLRLAAKNDEHERLSRASKWAEASKAHQEALALANEANRLLDSIDRYELKTASALWVDRVYPLAAGFAEALQPHYGTGGVRSLDFRGDCEGARQTVNEWVAQSTASRIPELLSPGTVSPDTRLVLTNAVWFRGAWQTPFATHDTRDESFTLASGEQVRTSTMRDPWRAGLRYAAFHGDGKPFATPKEVPANPDAKQPVCYPGNDGFAMVELPYRGREMSMLVIVPRSPDGLPRVEKLLTAERLTGFVASTRPFQVDLALPKFTMRVRTDLAPTLRELGAARAFETPAVDGGGAQFGGLTARREIEHALNISAVLHETWIEVGEEGTEAAAATAIMWDAAAAVMQTVPFRPVFHADRPFLFAIRDAESGTILFVGRVADPRA